MTSLQVPSFSSGQPLLSFFSLQNTLFQNFRSSPIRWARRALLLSSAHAGHAKTEAFLLRLTPGRPSRPFRSEDSSEFLLAFFVRKSYRFSAVRASRGRDGAAFALQRRPCCIAVRAPLQAREGLTAQRSQPRCFPTGLRPFVYGYE